MTRPDVSDLTESVYASLPEVYRTADSVQTRGPDYPLLRYLSTLLDQLEPVVDLVDRFSYIAQDERQDNTEGNEFGATYPLRRYGDGEYGDGYYGFSDLRTLNADLVDARVADTEWLPWLGQLLGVDLAGAVTDLDRRIRLVRPTLAHAHGTPGAIATAVRRVLTPTPPSIGYVQTIPSGFVIYLILRLSDVPQTLTYGELEAAAPTWGDLEALGPMDNGKIAPAIQAAETERPAGWFYRFQLIDDLGNVVPIGSD